MKYRIKSQNLGSIYIYHIERNTRFLFIPYWKRERHDLFYSQKEAEDHLPIFLAKKEASKKVKYYFVNDNEIISGESESDIVKKYKLRAFS